MMDMSSMIDAGLAILGAVAVMVAGAGTVFLQSTTVSTAPRMAGDAALEPAPVSSRQAA